MPCRSDYMEPNEAERHAQRTAKLILYVRDQLPNLPSVVGLTDKPLANVLSAVGNSYAHGGDAFTARLCRIISEMTPAQKATVMFDGRNAQARDLASWSEEHDAQDRAREELKARLADQELTLAIEEASGEMFEQVEALLALVPELTKTAPGKRLQAIVSTIRS